MRTLILVGLFVALSVCPSAAERVTVDQLEQKLAALSAAPQARSSIANEVGAESDLLRELNQGLGSFGLDADQAAEIESLELTERLTTTTLARLTAKYKQLPEFRHALEQLADRSALLDPPDAELPHQLPPDSDSQRKMVDAAGNYVLRVLSRLPNFFAIRTTERFDDAPVSVNGSVVGFPSSMRLVGSSSREITFRNGSEVVDPLKQERVMPGMPDPGLASSGEFGPEAAIVLSDLAKGTIEFHHWERTPAGLAAVYRYTVPKKSSNYQVDYSCGLYVSFHDTPGYHGSLAIDPMSGAIFRLTLEADSKKGDPITHVASVIDYGQVVIGGRGYICPLRSLAFMVEDTNACVRHSPKEKMMRPVTMLNRASFSDYHRLGSTARLVVEPSEAPSSAPPAQNP
jgi:hypothetical protein